MKALVTGAAGYIGSVVTESLLADGHQVIAVDSLENGHRGAVHPDATFVKGDLLDREWLIDFFASTQVDAVCHLAAEALIGVSLVDPGRSFHKNVTSSINLAEAMLRSGCKNIVFSSSAAVYGEPRGIPVRESDPLDPINAYGESKLMFERMMRWYGEAQGMQHVSLRYFNACGATERYGEDRPEETHLIPLALYTAMGLRSSLSVFGSDYPTHDGTCVRDYVHVSDIARAHVLALKNIDRIAGRAYNLGTGTGFSILEVIASVERVTGKKVNAVMTPRRNGDPATLVASFDRISEDLGWTPERSSIDEMVGDAYRWKARYPQGYAD